MIFSKKKKKSSLSVRIFSLSHSDFIKNDILYCIIFQKLEIYTLSWITVMEVGCNMFAFCLKYESFVVTRHI